MQFDLLLTQNVSAAGTEFSEKYVNIDKGGLLTAIATTKVPTVLAGGTDGYMLVRDDVEVTGLKWVARPTTDHAQNTDTGTTGATFAIDSDNATDGILLKAGAAGLTIRNIGDTGNDNLVAAGITCSGIGITGTRIILDSDSYAIEVTAESASKASVKVSGGATYADFQAKDITCNDLTVNGTTTTINSTTLAVDDKNIELGTVATPTDTTADGGGITLKGTTDKTIVWDNANDNWTLNQNVNIPTGTTYKINNTTVLSSTQVLGVDLSTKVTGPESTVNSRLALFDGTTGKLIKTSAYTENELLTAHFFEFANTLIIGTGLSTYAPLSVAASSVVGRKASGDTVALTPAELANVLCVTAPATKTSTGTAGQIAFDANFIYRCTATNVWTRGVMCTNW
jgi:hypothetical protein